MRERLRGFVRRVSFEGQRHHCQTHLVEGLVSEPYNLGLSFAGPLERARQEWVIHRIVVAAVQGEYACPGAKTGSSSKSASNG